MIIITKVGWVQGIGGKVGHSGGARTYMTPYVHTDYRDQRAFAFLIFKSDSSLSSPHALIVGCTPSGHVSYRVSTLTMTAESNKGR